MFSWTFWYITLFCLLLPKDTLYLYDYLFDKIHSFTLFTRYSWFTITTVFFKSLIHYWLKFTFLFRYTIFFCFLAYIDTLTHYVFLFNEIHSDIVFYSSIDDTLNTNVYFTLLIHYRLMFTFLMRFTTSICLLVDEDTLPLLVYLIPYDTLFNVVY